MAKRLKILHSRQIAGMGLGLVWSLLLGTICSRVPVVQKLELLIQDSLTRLHQVDAPPQEILLVTIDRAIAKPEHAFYTDLVARLIAAKAKVIAINLPYSLRRPLDSSLENPFKKLIEKYPDRIVLVTYTKRATSSVPAALSLYYHLLPFDNQKIQPLVAPERVNGFFEYETDLWDSTSPARQAHLAGNFVYVENLQQTYQLKSVALLAWEKFSARSSSKTSAIDSLSLLRRQTLRERDAPRTERLRQRTEPKNCRDVTCIYPNTIGIKFYGPAGTFPRLNISSLCLLTQTQLNRCSVPLSKLAEQKIHNKLVAIDLPPEYLASTGMVSPFGTRLSVAEVQANLIGNLMTDSFLRASPDWLNWTISTLGAVFFSFLASLSVTQTKYRDIYARIGLALGAIGVYMGLSIILFQKGSTLPLAAPILTWLGTGASVATCLLLWQKQQQLSKQRQALAERQAVLLQARKLLHRVATDIHDGPLQELKLVMDGIELLALKHPILNPDPLLDRLESVGRDLRDQLRNTRTLAEKLEITPQLQAGLDKGIELLLEQLITTGELTLEVKSYLQPLREPEDSNWIDAREDIFRFFKEAIANIISHAQPPNGTARQVTVSLSQSGNHCTLIVENDATEPLVSEDHTRRSRSGGYGTKLMATIAAELPEGDWERLPLAAGGMQVRLDWKLAATANDI
jgi:signal transduction histidine kinase